MFIFHSSPKKFVWVFRGQTAVRQRGREWAGGGLIWRLRTFILTPSLMGWRQQRTRGRGDVLVRTQNNRGQKPECVGHAHSHTHKHTLLTCNAPCTQHYPVLSHTVGSSREPNKNTNLTSRSLQVGASRLTPVSIPWADSKTSFFIVSLLATAL